jgi:hypothetical protein
MERFDATTYAGLWKLVADLEAGEVLRWCLVGDEVVEGNQCPDCEADTVVIDPAELKVDLVEDERRARDFMATVAPNPALEVVN